MAARITTYLVVGIVAATLIAGLIVGAQRDDSSGPVDLIVFNAKVYTADRSGTMAQAVAIRGNQILRVGSNRDVNRLRRPQTVAIDAAGASVLPGFNDAHVEMLAGGLALDQINLLGAESLDEMQARIGGWAEANPDRPWVLGRGWSIDTFAEGETPTRQALDAVVADRPARILSADGRTAWVNSRALAIAGITRRTPNPPGGLIVKDPRTGEPTGVLEDAAAALADRLVPSPAREDRLRALRAAIAEANRNGITSVQNAGAITDAELFDEVRRSGDLKVRVSTALTVPADLEAMPVDGIDAWSSKYPDDPLLKAGPVQITLDGSVESRRAAMLEPYEGKLLPAGDTAVAADVLNRTVRRLDARGYQVMIDAAGDRAVRMALDAFDHAARSGPAPERGRRHRIEGATIVDPADLKRFAPLGVIASMEPLEGNPTDGRIGAWTRLAGMERSAHAWPYHGLAASGARLAFGSGWPSGSLNPMAALHTAVTRLTAGGDPEGGWNASQALALNRALDAFTSGAAYASFDEQRKGSIEAGMLADLVVLTGDIFDAPPSHLAATAVALTIFDGKVVYRRSPKSSN